MSTPKKGIAYEFSMSLIDSASPTDFKVNPTIATGDFQVSTDNGAFTNLDTLPVVQPASSVLVKVNLSASEMSGDKVSIRAKDAAGAEWQEDLIFLDVPLENEDGFAAAVWDEILSGATHNISSSAGRRLRAITSPIVLEGFVVSSTMNTVTFDGGASTDDGAYDPAIIYIVDGLGKHQSRGIFEYDGGTKTAALDRDWKVEPDATSEFVIGPWAGRNHVNEGLATDGTLNTITLNALASEFDDVYIGQLITIRSGTGADQAGLVTAYDGTSKIATIEHDWVVIPDGTTAYAMMPFHVVFASENVDAIWNADSSSYTTSGTFGGDFDVLKSGMVRMLSLGNENVIWSDYSYDLSTTPPRILSAKINAYTDGTLTVRKTDSLGNVVYRLTQQYALDGSTSLLSVVRIT